MKFKSILILSFVIITSNIYSQENKTQKENIFIIADLTNDYFNLIEDVFPKDYVLEKKYFKYSQILPETVISPDKNISCIIETPIEYKTKFGKIETTELSDYETKYFYNEDGFLYKIVQENGIPSYQNANEENKVSENIMDFSIGKFGESTQKQNSYETNSNGISKIIQYNKDGDVFRRYEIFYNSKGQIIKYDTFERNNIQKEYTKSFEYDTNSNLIKTSLVENYENEIKTIPRRNVIYNFSNNVITCKSSWNDFAEGTNSISDFSKIGGVTLNDFINKKKLKITISDKSIQEIKKGITQKWKNSVVDYEYIFHSEIKINNWEEKKIFNKLYKQTSEKELIYSIKRKYINKEELKKENKLTETREKLNDFIEGIESDEAIKTKENNMRFASFDIELEKFCFWINAGGQYIFPKNENYTKEIVLFYKNQSYKLANDYKSKIKDKTLTNDELSLNFDELKTKYKEIIDQTFYKIENRKKFADLEKKDISIDKLYILYPLSQYKKIKKESLYSAYKTLYNEAFSKTEIAKDEYLELYKIQDKILQFEPLNTNKLEKTLKTEKDNLEIAKAILSFQAE
jgi:hypothetical protein